MMHQQLLSELFSIEGVLQVTLTDQEGLIEENLGEQGNIGAVVSDLISIVESSNIRIDRLTIEAEEGLILTDLLADGGMLITKFSNQANQGKIRSLSSEIKQSINNLD